MHKFGIIGLGDIARKAYLPVIASYPCEIHLYSRNTSSVETIAKQYRISHIHDSLESLLSSGIEAAFVHTATQAHFEIVKLLLDHQIHVYVDKPVTDQYDTTASLFEMATRKKLLLHVGFNRRFAPAYQNLKKLQDISMIVMQKNRKSLPGAVRTFVYDDFIHVIDTLLFLSPWKTSEMTVRGQKKNNLLSHVVIQLVSGRGEIATGIMNRDSGATEEKLEVFTPGGKWLVENVADTYLYQDKNITKLGQDDWTPTLRKRGFEYMVKHFYDAVVSCNITEPDSIALESHRICEAVVLQLEQL